MVRSTKRRIQEVAQVQNQDNSYNLRGSRASQTKRDDSSSSAKNIFKLRKIDEKNGHSLKIKIMKPQEQSLVISSKQKYKPKPMSTQPVQDIAVVSNYSFRRVNNKYLKNHLRPQTEPVLLDSLSFPKRVRAGQSQNTRSSAQVEKSKRGTVPGNTSTKIKIKNPFKPPMSSTFVKKEPTLNKINVFQPPAEKSMAQNQGISLQEFLKKEKLQRKFLLNQKQEMLAKNCVTPSEELFLLKLPIWEAEPNQEKIPQGNANSSRDALEIPQANQGQCLAAKKSKIMKVSEAMEEENFVEIVENNNKKIKVAIPKPFDYSKFADQIPNPIDTYARDINFRSHNFTREYKSGYAPIETQKLTEAKEKEFNYRNHFIKKKQSCANINLKRTCGVSYVKLSESKQFNVNHIFDTLPPLVYQCSTGKKRLEEYKEFYNYLFSYLFENGMQKGEYLLGSIVPAEHEDKMKEYLLYPNKRLELCEGRVFLFKQIEDLWPIYFEKQFLCLHFYFDEKKLIRPPYFETFSHEELKKNIIQTDLHLGLLLKKNICGKKSLLKSFNIGLIGEEESDDDDIENEKKDPSKLEEDKEPFKIRWKKTKQPKSEKKEHKHSDETKVECGENNKQTGGGINVEESNQKDGTVKKKRGRKSKAVKKEEELAKLNSAKKNPSPLKLPEPANLPKEEPIIDTNSGEQCNSEKQEDVKNEEKRKEDSEIIFVSHFERNGPAISPKLEHIIVELNNSNTVSTALPNQSSPQTSVSFTLLEEKVEKLECAKAETEVCKYYLHPNFIKFLETERGRNTMGICIRMELYVNEQQWKECENGLVHDLLNSFVLHCSEKFEEKKNLNMINIRYKVLEEGKIETVHKALAKLRSFKITSLIPNEASKKSAVHLKKWKFNPAAFIENEFFKIQHKNETELDIEENQKLISLSQPFSLADNFNKGSFESLNLQLPLYYITTRDSFAYDLIEKKTILNMNGRKVIRREYFFHPDVKPQNFSHFEKDFPDYRVGVVSYENFFSHEELLDIENSCFDTEKKCFQSHFLPMTAQYTCTSEKVRRTKFFFGTRYIWSRTQLSEPYSFVAAGIRCDVSSPPEWLKKKIEKPLSDNNIIPKNFINSFALNVYHDGKEGLAQHFDDAVRFRQPIFTLRLFSDCRLSFGSQFYGFCNGAFCIPLPRGCVCVMEENSYAANGVKHCVRPCDMTGKSAALILRQMHMNCVEESEIYDRAVEFPAWFSTLSLNENSVPYSEQKRLEAEKILSKSNKKLPYIM